MKTMVEKLRDGIARLDAYGAPDDDAPLFVDSNGCGYEVLDGNEVADPDAPCNPFTLGMLRLLVAECEA